uniref:Complement C3 n=1 Tax=Xenopus tropicalis TaxID=8364 RepID=A0A6I8S561_XENTR
MREFGNPCGPSPSLIGLFDEGSCPPRCISFKSPLQPVSAHSPVCSMGSGLLSLSLLLLVSGSYAQPQCSLITPNLLRAESEETIIIDAQGQNAAFEVEIIIHEFPQKKLNLASAKVTLNSDNKFLGTATVKIPSADVPKDKQNKQYVYVSLKSNVCALEKVVMLSYHSGYIFLQTDKTIYTPGSTVLYRIYSMNYKMQPISKTLIIEFVTPDGVIVKRDSILQDSKSGIISLSHKLPELLSLGVWTISAKYEDTPQQNYTTNFEVKEYVLPSMEIILKPDTNFFYADANSFGVDIHAQYLYGKHVDGYAFVLFGIRKDNVKKGIPESLTRVRIDDGEGRAELKREDLVKYFAKQEDMLQYCLYVTVSVVTETGSDMVEAEIECINIVTTPYKILFTRTSKYFKPGMPFDMMVYVTNPDGSPARRITVAAEPGNIEGTTQADGTTRLTMNTRPDIDRLHITVKTKDPVLPAARQATATMTATAYRPSKAQGNYLHISIAGSEIKPGENIPVNFNIRNTDAGVQNLIQQFTYLIMSRGRIVKVGRQARQPGQPFVTMSLSVTEALIPSFRIVAYYIVSSGGARDVVSDSLWVDVVDECMGTLSVTGDKDRDNAIQTPGSPMKLKLRADHKSYVGLVAVDKGVYVLNSKFKNTQKKVWDSVEKSDIGCTPGSGANSEGVFSDAGLALQTSFGTNTAQRSEAHCPAPAQRRKRSSVAIIEIKAGKASEYKDKAKKCCLDGMQENLMGHTCERRARYILDGKECVDAFVDCCKYYEKKREAERLSKDEDTLGRSDEDDEYMLDSDIVSRTEFPESWFWKVEQMVEKADANGISTKTLNVFLKDSITTWEVLAVSLSETKGLCVAQPYEIKVMKDFFIDLKLPYSVVRNEQVEIRAILYNYRNDRIKVRVELTHNPEFCSLATPKKKYRQEVWIGALSSTAVPMVIVPLTLGQHDIEVKASVAGSFANDGVRKKLKVVPEGMRIAQDVKTVILEPDVKGKDGVQEEEIKALNPKNVVPRTDIDTTITLQGTPISQMVEDAIDGNNMNHLIVVPFGCGEQNMMTTTASVIATRYLDTTGQWPRVGVNRRNEALNNMKYGYTRQMAYRKPDNSYAAFQNIPTSTWLTGYVARVFGMAQEFIEIEANVLCGAVKWLILERQKPDGLFYENAPVFMQIMAGGITTGAAEVDSSLTAFIVIAMLECRRTCNAHVNNLQVSIDKATDYLIGRYPGLQTPYSIAITSYALALAGKLPNTNKLLSVAIDKTHWVEPGKHFISLEATSYGLLCLLKMKEFDLTGGIVHWLSEKRYYGEVLGSTQATIVMFQALAQYQTDVPGLNELNLDVSLHLPERQQPLTYRINHENALLARSAETRLNQDFVVKAKGKGQGTIRVVTVYHALVTEKERKCSNFDLTVKVKEERIAKRPEGAMGTVSIEACARYLKNFDATMSIIDISMMTGYSPDTDSLDRLMKGVDKYISKYEVNKGANERGTLILYLNKISHTEEECVKFYAHQFFEVGFIQPASVTVYDYYNPENRCTKFYHVEEGSALLGRICQDDICRCAEENCFMQQQIEGKITAEMRVNMACAPGVDFVYKATLTEVQQSENFDNYVMRIHKVIKQGTDENLEDKTRNFISHIKCRRALSMQLNRDYLIWGVTGDLWRQPDGYSYIIGKDTWIEWWPNERECQQRENLDLCDDFETVSDNLEIVGCPN